MDQEYFINLAKHQIKDLYGVAMKNVFVTWSAKVAQNNKVMIGVKDSNVYYEVTRMGDLNTMVIERYDLNASVSVQIEE